MGIETECCWNCKRLMNCNEGIIAFMREEVIDHVCKHYEKEEKLYPNSEVNHEHG